MLVQENGESDEHVEQASLSMVLVRLPKTMVMRSCFLGRLANGLVSSLSVLSSLGPFPLRSSSLGPSLPRLSPPAFLKASLMWAVSRFCWSEVVGCLWAEKPLNWDTEISEVCLWLASMFRAVIRQFSAAVSDSSGKRAV